MNESAVHERIGANLRAARKDAGLTQADLSARMVELGFTAWSAQSVASLVESGKRRIQANEVGALANMFPNVDLFAGTPFRSASTHDRNTTVSTDESYTGQAVTLPPNTYGHLVDVDAANNAYHVDTNGTPLPCGAPPDAKVAVVTEELIQEISEEVAAMVRVTLRRKLLGG